MFAIPALRELKHFGHWLDVATRNPMSRAPFGDVVLALQQKHRTAGVYDVIPGTRHGDRKVNHEVTPVHLAILHGQLDLFALRTQGGGDEASATNKYGYAERTPGAATPPLPFAAINQAWRRSQRERMNRPDVVARRVEDNSVKFGEFLECTVKFF